MLSITHRHAAPKVCVCVCVCVCVGGGRGVVDNIFHFLFGSSPEPERLKNKLKLSGRCRAFTTNSNLESILNTLQTPTSDRDFTGKWGREERDGGRREEVRNRRRERDGDRRRSMRTEGGKKERGA